jgi:hypothetical protein
MTEDWQSAYEDLQRRCLHARKAKTLDILERALDVLLRHPDRTGAPELLAYNAIREARRTGQRRAKAVPIQLGLPSETSPTFDAPPTEGDFTEAEVQDWIDAAPLRPREREILRSKVAGDPPEVTAERIGVSKPTLRVVVCRMRSAARAYHEQVLSGFTMPSAA